MCESVLTASKYVNLSMLSIFKDVTPAEVQAGFLSGCDSLPYLSLMTHPSQTDWYLYKNFGIWWEFLFSVTFCRCLEPAGGRAAAVAGRGGRRAGRTGGEEAQPQGASGCLRVPQRPGGSRPSSPHARGRCGGRPPEGGSRQGAAPPCLGRALRPQRRCWGDLCPQLLGQHRGVRRRAGVLSTSTTTGACPAGWLSKSAPVANGTIRVSSHTVGVWKQPAPGVI